VRYGDAVRGEMKTMNENETGKIERKVTGKDQ
jgi:hypothetical protein